MNQGCMLLAYTELCVASSEYSYEPPMQALSGTIVNAEKLPVPIIGNHCTKSPCKLWIYVDDGDRMSYIARQANLSRDQFLEVNSNCFDRSNHAARDLENQLDAWHWYCVAI
jgi:hypothetical protein